MEWEDNIRAAINEVDRAIEDLGEPFAPARKWGISSETGRLMGLELRKTVLEDALLIGRHGLPEPGQFACQDPDCKSFGEPHIAGSDQCHIFGVD